MGQGLAFRWAKAGYPIIIGSRDLQRAVAAAGKVRARVPHGQIEGQTNESAVRLAQIIVLTLPYAQRESTLNSIAGHVRGKLVVDTTVPLKAGSAGRVELPKAGCAAVETAQLLGDGVEVVAAFHNIAAHLLHSDALIEGEVLVAGEDAVARERVIALATAAGIRSWHAGPLANAAAAEALTSVLIQINKRYACHAAGIQIVGHRRPPTPGRTPERLELIGVHGIPLIKEGDDIAQVLWDALLANSLHVTEDDIFVVSHKIVSKAEGCMVRLDDIAPNDAAQQLARETEKDARIVQVILNESKEIVRKKRGVIIVEHRLGFVMANAGVDQSNVPAGCVLLLPRDPDQSAEDLRQRWQSLCQKRLAVIIADSVGRAWRNGVIGHAIGVAGMEPLEDLRGRQDMLGRPLHHTQTAIVDSIASAAALVMGEASEAVPLVLVRGFHRNDNSKGIRTLLRDRSEDLFR